MPGAKLHSNSGAGPVKGDASDENNLYEIKDANLSHTLSSKDLETLWKNACNQGKDPHYVIYFSGGLVADISIHKL